MLHSLTIALHDAIYWAALVLLSHARCGSFIPYVTDTICIIFTRALSCEATGTLWFLNEMFKEVKIYSNFGQKAAVVTLGQEL